MFIINTRLVYFLRPENTSCCSLNEVEISEDIANIDLRAGYVLCLGKTEVEGNICRGSEIFDAFDIPQISDVSSNGNTLCLDAGGKLPTVEAKIIEASGNYKEVDYDRAVRRVLALKQVIARILKGTVPEFAELTAGEIVDNHLSGAKITIGDAASQYEVNVNAEDPHINEAGLPENIFDVKFTVRLKDGEEAVCFLHIDLEGQLSFTPGYPLAKRANYHLARQFSTQIDRIGIKGENYNKLSKVMSIWLCFAPPTGHGNEITRFHMQQESIVGTYKFKTEDVDMQEAVFILLGKEDGSDVALLQFLDVLFSRRLQVSERLRRLDALGFPIYEDNFEEEVNKMVEKGKLYYGYFEEELVKEKDAEIAKKDAEIAQKDAEIAREKARADAEIARLKNMLRAHGISPN